MAGTKLSTRLKKLNESATLALNARVKQMATEGKTIYNLTAGELATGTPEYIQKAVAGSLAFNKYTPVAGLYELREAIASHAREFYGLDWIKADNVVATAGVKPALYASLLTIINPGDEVIVPVPGWTTSYKPIIELCGGVIVEVPLNASLDLDVGRMINIISTKTKAIILNSPNNPTGAIYSRQALDKLAAAIKGKGIVIIADDIYSKLVYDDSFALVPKCDYENLIIVNGFSKSQALTGWRIGYMIADAPIAKAATNLLSHITGNAALPSQYAAIEALKHSDAPPTTTMQDLRLQRQIVIDGLDECGIKHNKPSGAFYVFLDVRQFSGDSNQWCEDLLGQTGVALVPGEAFSAPGFARMSFVADQKNLKNALRQIKLFCKKA
jgi:aspartate aminotransferase